MSHRLVVLAACLCLQFLHVPTSCAIRNQETAAYGSRRQPRIAEFHEQRASSSPESIHQLSSTHKNAFTIRGSDYTEDGAGDSIKRTESASVLTNSPLFMLDTPQSTIKSKFKLELKNMGTNTEYDEDMRRAAMKWEKVIVGDLPDIPQRRIKSLFRDDFNATVQQDVDDTIIGYRFGDLGLGPDAVGLARPIHVRSNANGEPISTISGTMVFSEAAFQRFSQTQIEATIEHEMGHVLGIGLFTSGACWDEFNHCSDDSFAYKCPRAQAAYNALGFSGALRVADGETEGSACGHWNEKSFESVLWTDLMTPSYTNTKPMLLTAVTIAALEDLGGYEVDYAAAEGPSPWHDSTMSEFKESLAMRASIYTQEEGNKHGSTSSPLQMKNLFWSGTWILVFLFYAMAILASITSRSDHIR